jgi:hypothetical protein
MKNSFRLPLLCSAVFFSVSPLFSADNEEVQDTDLQAIREWINTKRQVTVKELGGALSISGEVRTEFQTTHETKNGVKQRGPGSPCGIPNQGFDVEVNLMFDYRMERSWAAIKLEFDNDAGALSGTFHKVKLEKAYFGVRAMDLDTITFDIEFGRRRLATIFDSLIEFDSFFDGILFRYDQGFESIGDFYVRLGTFVIDEKKDQYGYVGEIGLLNIGNTGLYTKYSLIDWDTKHFNDKVQQERFDFLISQLILGYKFVPKNWLKAVTVFVAGLYNHAAHKIKITDYKRANAAGYIGFIVGELKKRNDWAIQANYQVVQAQAIPDYDLAGIGLGNACRSGFYTAKTDGTGDPTTRKTAAGNTNYRGFSITLDYLLLNNLDFQQSWNQSITLDDKIGPFRRYHQYEAELIYAF